MNRNLLIAAAVFLGSLVIAWMFFLRRAPDDAYRGSIVGSVEVAKGNVTSRLPRTIEFRAIAAPRPLVNQEVIQTADNSEAQIALSTLTTLQLQPATRFVVETDATKSDALIGTILEGQVTVLDPGAAGKFRLFQRGRELPLDRGPVDGPNPIRPGTPVPMGGLVITATTPEDSAAEPPAEPVAPTPDKSEVSSDVLTNDDIVRQLRGQTGFFQRCYLGFINRMRAERPNDPKIPAGNIVVSFRVQNTGRVIDATVRRSDFKDEILDRCITEVVERTRFKRFSGVTVPVLEFPIRLH